MPTKPGGSAKVVLPAQVPVGFDELNLGRLALNSAQKSVPPDLRRWEKNILTPDGRPVSVVCTVEEGEVVPHGLDNDFMVGLLNLCFEAGVPSGPFMITGYALLKAAGLPDTQQYYQSMQESLRRLSKAKYSVNEAWYARNSGEWLSQEFSQISYLAVRRSAGGLTARGTIVVQLGVPILESLRAGYIKPLDLDFYRSLSQPLVRALYRQLDALHFDETAEDGLAREVRAPLLAWAVRLGLFSDRTDNIVRALKPAHEELMARGYLSQVEADGRGRDKAVQYVFAGPPRTDHPELAIPLMERGVNKGMALRLSAAFPGRIEQAVTRFDAYRKTAKTPINNPGGLLVSMIKAPEQYGDLQPEAATPKPARTSGTGRSSSKEIRAVEQQQEVLVDRLSGAELQSWALRQLGLSGVLKHLSTPEKVVLSEVLNGGRLNPRLIVSQALKAAYDGGTAVLELAEELKKHI